MIKASLLHMNDGCPGLESPGHSPSILSADLPVAACRERVGLFCVKSALSSDMTRLANNGEPLL